MKKLLLLGALLTVGATSFAFTQTADLGVAGTSSEGTVGLHLEATGKVVAPTDNHHMLVIKPTVTSVEKGDTIVFDFAELTPGQTKNMDGAFEAKIYLGAADGDKEYELAKIKDHISSALLLEGVEQNGGVATVTVLSATGTEVTGTENQVGTLTYTLNAGVSDQTTYTGNIKAELAVLNTAISGTFNDSSVDVVVNVEASAIASN